MRNEKQREREKGIKIRKEERRRSIERMIKRKEKKEKRKKNMKSERTEREEKIHTERDKKWRDIKREGK